ncbi:MAG: ATP-dependent helicase HrpB, partial [Rhodobacteraceae bacterium]|nr:ATP-dependent helicase HrpB [Paracoccaceae bacterium]
MNAQLPIHDVLDDLIRAVQAEQRVVLCAPPGAGKTTVVPLALLTECGFDGKIIMLEPRRLAAHAAAERMAESLSEKVGQTVGYRIRGVS